MLPAQTGNLLNGHRMAKPLTLSFSVTYTEEGAIKEMLIAESYKLSDDGKTLTIETYSKNEVTGESKTISLYNKK